MDILIPDEWLREFVKTKATNKTIAEKMSLCGPSVEKISGTGKNATYLIEVTTNRTDTMSVYGIAREASAILPRFGIPAKLTIPPTPKLLKTKNIKIKIEPDIKLVRRVMAVKISDIKNWQTPLWMKTRLILSGIRSLNSVVDITNYIMLETGHPTHVFDWDKVYKHGLYIRNAHKGDKFISLEGKRYNLRDNDLVIADDKGTIIDLPGIIGAENSVVTKNTKNVLFFIDNNDPATIRKTSMRLAIRTHAATLNEKWIDPELGEIAMAKGIILFQKVCKAKIASAVFDWHPNPYKETEIKTEKKEIEDMLGTTLSKTQISSFLKPLGFTSSWQENTLITKVPSIRANDIQIPADIIEEVARIYGYFNLPGTLAIGNPPQTYSSRLYDFENKIKNLLASFGGYEVYNLSLVSKKEAGKNALRLKNPMGKDFEYLRTSLYPSLYKGVVENKSEKEKYILFEIANVYLNQRGTLPIEEPKLGVIFYKYQFSEAKGILEALLDKLHIYFKLELKPDIYLAPDKSTHVVANGKTLGTFGISKDGYCYFELDVNGLFTLHKPFLPYKPVPKYPPQIEDLTIKLSGQIFLGEIIENLKKQSKKVAEVKLIDEYRNNYTFRIYYQDFRKTLTDREVQKERNKLLDYIKKLPNATVI